MAIVNHALPLPELNVNSHLVNYKHRQHKQVNIKSNSLKKKFPKMFAKLKTPTTTSIRNDHNGSSIKVFFDRFHRGFKIHRGLQKPGHQQTETITEDGSVKQRETRYITCDKDMNLLDELIIAAANSYSTHSPALKVDADENASRVGRTNKYGTSVTSRSSSSFMKDNLDTQTPDLKYIKELSSNSSSDRCLLKKTKSLEGTEWYRNEDRKLELKKLVDEIDKTINLYANIYAYPALSITTTATTTTTTTHSPPSSPPLPAVEPLRIKAPELKNIIPISLDSPSQTNLQNGSFIDCYRNLGVQDIMNEIDTDIRLFHPTYFAAIESDEPVKPNEHEHEHEKNVSNCNITIAITAATTPSPDRSIENLEIFERFIRDGEVEYLQIPKHHHNKPNKIQATFKSNKTKATVNNNDNNNNNNHNTNNNIINPSVVGPSGKRVKKPFINYTDEWNRGKASPPLVSHSSHKTPSIQTILANFWSDLCAFWGQRPRKARI
ncbi:hypothetical protein V1514DRAFT_341455 [Lipomyces japonicus]|uniref:uncharacterized protein n=1 Tax=Lipomyces japonicus TaxID=56871 RepID=UPI0034CE84DA